LAVLWERLALFESLAALLSAYQKGGKPMMQGRIQSVIDAPHVLSFKADPRDQIPDREIFRLTPRERAVALLIAQGATNRDLARHLVITEGTAANHVKHILSKLGFASRARGAAWAVHHGLAAAY
jgi:DNA-binding NarL/FixJ family response regulator